MKFQNPSNHRSKVNGRTHTEIDRHTDKPKVKVGGITNKLRTNQSLPEKFKVSNNPVIRN